MRVVHMPQEPERFGGHRINLLRMPNWDRREAKPRVDPSDTRIRRSSLSVQLGFGGTVPTMRTVAHQSPFFGQEMLSAHRLIQAAQKSLPDGQLREGRSPICLTSAERWGSTSLTWTSSSPVIPFVTFQTNLSVFTVFNGDPRLLGPARTAFLRTGTGAAGVDPLLSCTLARQRRRC